MYPSKFNKPLEKFKNIHAGKNAILIVPGPSFTKKWSNKPYFPAYKNSIKFTANRMIYINPDVANECDYYFFGSWFNKDLDLQKMQIDYHNRTPNCVKFASSYEHGRSHKDINRGNIHPEQAKKMGVIPYENNLTHFTDDIANYATLGHSVIFPAMQFILYMGFSTIYLLGCDGGITLPQYKSSGDPHIIHWWTEFKNWYKGTAIIVSINPVSLKGMFVDAYI